MLEDPPPHTEDEAAGEVELEDEENAHAAEEDEHEEGTDQAMESDDDEEVVDETLDADSWVGVDAAAALLPVHIRCAAHTLSLCATTDVDNVLEARLKASHGGVMGGCNVLWSRSCRPHSAELSKP